MTTVQGCPTASVFSEYCTLMQTLSKYASFTFKGFQLESKKKDSLFSYLLLHCDDKPILWRFHNFRAFCLLLSQALPSFPHLCHILPLSHIHIWFCFCLFVSWHSVLHQDFLCGYCFRTLHWSLMANHVLQYWEQGQSLSRSHHFTHYCFLHYAFIFLLNNTSNFRF